MTGFCECGSLCSGFVKTEFLDHMSNYQHFKNVPVPCIESYLYVCIYLLFLGNKCDLESLREVEFAEAEAMCEYIPEILFVLEASAKENTNIDDAFMCLATELKVGNCC